MTENQIKIFNEIQSNHFSEYLKTRREVEDELSNEQSVFCVCGRLATGFHESSCRKFQNKVNCGVVKKLKHLPATTVV